ncbi:DUF4397 domain-containing protein [Chitinophaga sp. OAE865]|uniref:DUF4397 domain-containing protein n=1 Tax=Chitinophaga sp. OAE865 TaxID=2817898 RepID=UPI001AE886EE
MLTKKNRVWAVVALLTGIIGFSSCLKNDNNYTPQRPQAQIAILGSSTSMIPGIFYDNDQKVTETEFNYNFYARYAVYGGLHKFDLKKKGGDSLFTSTTYNFDSTQYYTYLIWDKAPVRSAIIKTDQSNYSRDKIGIRFLNLSQNAGPVDVYIGAEKIDSNRVYFDGNVSAASAFKLYSSFSTGSSISIKEAGTTNELAKVSGADLRIGNFNTGYYYTIYLMGVKGSSGTDKLVTNAIFSLY